MSEQKVSVAELAEVKAAEMKPGVLTRRTLAYNGQIMLCHFTMEEGLKLELHKHDAVQVGYVIQGRLKFVKEDGSGFVAEAGTSYVFDSNEVHGIDEVYEHSELIECFSPMRPEYI